MRVLHDPGLKRLDLKAFWRGNDGAAAAEFALLVTPLVLLIFGIIEMGIMMWSQNVLNFAVQGAARCAAVGYPIGNSSATCYTTGTTQNYAVSQAVGLNIATSAFTVNNAATCGTGVTGYKVTGTYAFKFIPAGLFPAGPTLSSSLCIP